MPTENIEVFVICSVSSIPAGGARPFMLARADGAGGSSPFPIFVVNTRSNEYIGYLNACPHKGALLNSLSGGFFSQDRKSLECGSHGARFEIATGLCIDGPCEGKSLEPVALAVIDGDICLCGVELAEDDIAPAKGAGAEALSRPQ